MESALYGVYTLVVLCQKSHSFASLTRSISDTPQLVCKHRTHALSMKYSICITIGTVPVSLGVPAHKLPFGSGKFENMFGAKGWSVTLRMFGGLREYLEVFFFKGSWRIAVITIENLEES